MWPAIIGAGIGLLGDIWSADSARQGQREANRMNLQMAREQMGFQERMSNTEWQRSVKDMIAAGINPMLAFMKGGASTPPGAMSHAESETAESSRILSNSASKAAATLAALENMKATTRKTNAEAAMIEADIPFSGANAQARSNIVTEQFVRLQQDVEKAALEIKGLKMTQAQFEEMAPLLVRAQKLVNEGLRMGLSKKDLEKNVADFLGIPFEYGAEAVKHLNEFGSALGRGAADAEEWFRSLPARWNEMRRRYHRDSERK